MHCVDISALEHQYILHHILINSTFHVLEMDILKVLMA